MSKPSPARYRTTNRSAYNDALRKRGSLLIWLDKEMAWHAPHEGRPGRPPVFSNAAIQFCLSIKVLFKLPLRQATGMVASLLRLAGRECHELCVSDLAHAVSDTQAAKRSPNIMANWLRAANHSLTFRPSFSKLRMAR